MIISSDTVGWTNQCNQFYRDIFVYLKKKIAKENFKCTLFSKLHFYKTISV